MQRGGRGKGRGGRGGGRRGGRGGVGVGGRGGSVVAGIEGGMEGGEGSHGALLGERTVWSAAGGGVNPSRDSNRNNSLEKVRVEGARRVWGTMRVTTSSSLRYAVSKVFNATSLQIKRKTVSDHAGQVKRWWFIIHAPENVLLNLDAAWEQLKLQTGWKLEPCFKPSSQHISQTTSSANTTPQSQVRTSEEPTISHESQAPDSDKQSTTHTSPGKSPFLGN